MLNGRDDDLSTIRLDMSNVSDFARTIYTAARNIKPGGTATYGDVARLAGMAPSGTARAVGRALSVNPFPIIVPCHRVVAANGRLGGFSATGGTTTKIKMLLLESRGAGVAVAPPYDLDAALTALSEADPRLAHAITTIGPCALRLRPMGTTVSALCESIMSQQLSTRAAATIYARLCEQFTHPLNGPTTGGILAMSDGELRGAGLSASKIAAVRDLAARDAAGEVPSLAELAEMEDEDVVAALTPIRGIGRWTVEMLLIFRLGRPDVLPIDDLGVRKGMARLMGKESITPSELTAVGQAWKPYSSVASWYLWRMSELP